MRTVEIIIETRPARTNGFDAYVSQGPYPARLLTDWAMDRTEAYRGLRQAVTEHRTLRGMRLDFIHAQTGE